MCSMYTCIYVHTYHIRICLCTYHIVGFCCEVQIFAKFADSQKFHWLLKFLFIIFYAKYKNFHKYLNSKYFFWKWFSQHRKYLNSQQKPVIWYVHIHLFSNCEYIHHTYVSETSLCSKIIWYHFKLTETYISFKEMITQLCLVNALIIPSTSHLYRWHNSTNHQKIKFKLNWYYTVKYYVKWEWGKCIMDEIA